MRKLLIYIAFGFGFIAAPSSLYASEDIHYARLNNENYFVTDHPRIETLALHADGSMTGVTEQGGTFSQHTILLTDTVKVDRFEIDDHFHFIVNGEAVYTTDALSRILAQSTK
jgi:hypothetical protein